MAVKVLDAGGKLMLSSPDREEVVAELARRLRQGANLIAEAQKVGATWVAACTMTKAPDADSTQTLRFSELSEQPKAQLGEQPEHDDGCKVDVLGLKRIITGPTRQAVVNRLEHLKKFGIDLVGQIEQEGDSWVAVADGGGADKVFRF